MTDIWTRLKGESLPILLYGTGNGADKILDECERLSIKIEGVFASSGFVRDRFFRGYKVISFEQAEEIFGQFVALMAFGSNRAEVLDNIKYIMSRQTLLAPDVPVYGKDIFNIDYAIKHRKELFAAYSLLADEQSRKVFEQTVLYKLDGDISRLFSCESDEDEAFEKILSLAKGDSFLDVGAYNGDTVLDFARRVGEYGRITAIEPDKRSFLKLVRNTEGMGVECINAAIGKECGEMPFSSKGSRGSNAGKGETIKTVSIDLLASEVGFDYIKLDVEGMEYAALCSAEKTIVKHRPKMLVSAYHKSEDLFTLPIKLHELCPEYKIYMRHYPYVPAWDTNFYAV